MTKQEAMGYMLIALKESGFKDIEDTKMFLRNMAEAIDEFTGEYAENTFDDFMSS